MTTTPSAAPLIRVDDDLSELPLDAWNGLLAASPLPSPFMRLEYLRAMQASGSAVPKTGWQAQFLSVWEGDQLIAACPAYLKSHSYGEYVQLCKVTPLDQVSGRPDDERSENSRRRCANGRISWAAAG